MRKKKEIEVELEIKYVPLPPEKRLEWMQAMELTVEMVYADWLKENQDAERNKE